MHFLNDCGYLCTTGITLSLHCISSHHFADVMQRQWVSSPVQVHQVCFDSFSDVLATHVKHTWHPSPRPWAKHMCRKHLENPWTGLLKYLEEWCATEKLFHSLGRHSRELCCLLWMHVSICCFSTALPGASLQARTSIKPFLNMTRLSPAALESHCVQRCVNSDQRNRRTQDRFVFHDQQRRLKSDWPLLKASPWQRNISGGECRKRSFEVTWVPSRYTFTRVTTAASLARDGTTVRPRKTA